jgi:dolichol-phosphate mannosyltransferase
MTSVSVVIPTFNESENVVRVIGEVKKASPDYNIIVVDDSNDNHRTRILAKMNGAEVLEGQHKGLGQAIIDGIKASNSDVIVVMDCDLSHPPAKIPELVEACQNGCGLSVGSRYVKGGSIVGWTFKRRIISLVASLLAYPITRIHDNTSGYFAVSKRILDGVVLQADSWKIMLEVLVKTGAKVVEIPIEFKDREAGKSKFNRKEVYAYLKHLVKLAFHKWRMLSFMLVGGIGYIVNMAVYYPLTLWFQKTVTFLGQEFYLPPFLVSSFIAITSNYILNKRFTFGDYQEKKLGYIKYLTTCSASLPIEMVLIFLFVKFMGFMPIVAVAVAILLVFIGRYAVLSRIVWGKKQRNIY